MSESLLRELVQKTESLILTHAKEAGINITIVNDGSTASDKYN